MNRTSLSKMSLHAWATSLLWPSPAIRTNGLRLGNMAYALRSVVRANVRILVIMVLAVTVRLFWLQDIPYRVDGDAARLGLDGAYVLQNRLPLLGTGWSGYTNLSLYVYGLFIQATGDEILGVRLFSALGGSLGVAAVYLLARQLLGERVGLFSAFFLSVLPFHLVFSRSGLDLVWPILFAALGLYLLPAHALLAGAVVGLAQYFYHAAKLVPILVLFYCVIRRMPLRQILCLAVGFLLVFGPMLCYYVQHPDTFFTRINEVSVFQTGGFSGWSDALERLARNFLVFLFPVQGSLLYFVYTPYLEIVARVLFAAGLVIGMARIKQWPYQLLLFWFAAGVVLGGVFTAKSPLPNRFTILLPPVVILMGRGLEGLGKLTERKLRASLHAILLIAVLGLYAITSLGSYWLHDTRDIYRQDLNTQIATVAGRYLMERQDEYHVYFLGEIKPDPRFSLGYESIPTLRFLTGRTGTDIWGSVKDALPFVDNSVLIVLPGRETELGELIGLCPGASVSRFRSQSGTLLFSMVENCAPAPAKTAE